MNQLMKWTVLHRVASNCETLQCEPMTKGILYSLHLRIHFDLLHEVAHKQSRDLSIKKKKSFMEIIQYFNVI